TRALLRQRGALHLAGPGIQAPKMIAAALAPPDEPPVVGDDPVRARHLGGNRELPEPPGLRIETTDLFPVALDEPDVAPRVHGEVVGDRRARSEERRVGKEGRSGWG